MTHPSEPPPPSITARFGGGERTFAPGDEVRIGRDIRAGIRLPEPVVSRVHALLRYANDRWVVVDNDSMNGLFVDGQQVRSIDVRNGQTIHVGHKDGPSLAFELVPQADERPTTPMDFEPDVSNMPTKVVRPRRLGTRSTPPPGATTLGRAPDNTIVIPDVLASHYHAVLVPTEQGVEIRDAGSMNGTFVNGGRVDAAVLHDGDVVTIGNADLVFSSGALVPRAEPPSKTGGLEVCRVSVTVEGNRTLLDDISFSAAPGTLTAVIGPSGSGKSTLSKAITGGTWPERGTVLFEGRDLHAEFASLRSRIGLVPQEDVVHRQLTVNQVLGYAAELRMPPDTSEQDRQRVVTQVLAELELTPHADKRVDKLSGGQRKRVSVALELLTGPSLLVLDEPTTGLDPALDQQVMKMLRHLADAGRVVVVVTHSLAYLEVCDQVVLLAPGGKTAFCGPPDDIGPAMGTTDWADIFTAVSADPDAARRRYLERSELPVSPPAAAEAEKPAPTGKPVHTSVWRQFSTVARRQMRLLVADRGYVVLLVLLPFLVGLLPLTVAGHAGFNMPPLDSTAPLEPKHIVALLNFGTILMGTTLTVRDLIGERLVFRREQAVGLSTSAYLLAKIAVYSVVAVLQSAVLVLVVTAPKIGKPAPAGAAALGSPMLELFVGVAATCVVAAVLGLLLSAYAQTNDQMIVLLAVALTAQLVLAGGFIPVTGRPLLDTISWITPARWGFAATASTADLSHLVMGIAQDSHWKHTASAWYFDLLMLAVLAVCYAAITRWRIRLKSRRR
ncbi:MAG: transport system ATP-binding/permease protein [Mycobacterium sp.]|nr:transport system ATP-binding/permease protein [Mycobacterium sp.]